MTKLQQDPIHVQPTDAPEAPVSTADLKTEAEVQLKRLLHQGKHIGKLRSNLDIIMQRHHVEQSYLSQLSEWYGSKPLWIKVSLNISVATTAAALGAIFNLAAVLGAVVGALYLGITYLLQNDYDITQARDKRLKEDIQQMEKELVSTVEHLSELEDSLKAVFTSLCELNCHMADDIQSFEEKIVGLQENIDRFNGVIKNLEETNTALSQTNETMKSQFEQTRANLDETNQALSDESDELEEINLGFDRTQQQPGADHAAMVRVTEAFHSSTQHLTAFAETLQTIIPKLQEQSTKSQASHEALLAKLTTSVDQTLETQSSSHEVLTHAKETLAMALQELNDFEDFHSHMEDDLVELARDKKPFPTESLRLLSQCTQASRSHGIQNMVYLSQ